MEMSGYPDVFFEDLFTSAAHDKADGFLDERHRQDPDGRIDPDGCKKKRIQKMAYSTVAEMIKLLPENMLITLSSDEAGATEVDQVNIDEAIDEADRVIDSYINAVTTLPLTTVPPLVTNLSTKMAIWNLHLRKYFNNEQWRREYEDCLKLLLQINQNKLSIFSDGSGTAPAAVGSSRQQKFTETLWEKWR